MLGGLKIPVLQSHLGEIAALLTAIFWTVTALSFERAGKLIGSLAVNWIRMGTTVATKALLDQNPDPTDEEIRQALRWNICRCAGYSKILAAVRKAADLVGVLKGEGPFTVFAPTDKAFSSLPKGALDQLLKDPEQLKSVLLYHVCRGKTPASAVIRMESA